MILNEKAFNFAKRILKLYENKENSRKNVEQTQQTIEAPLTVDERRVIGKTDYKKFENIAKGIELEEAMADPKTQDVLKMGCNNDLRKERQLMDKPSKDKIEAAKIFKTEGDDYLKEKKYLEALNAYEKGLLQLFYTFSDDPEEDKKVDILKSAINMNMSMCEINLGKYDEAVGFCLEALRIDKRNLKAIYRIAYSYFKLEKFEESRKYIDEGLKVDSNCGEFHSLSNMIAEREKEMDNESRKLFKKIVMN